MVRSNAKITAKGQITLPVAVRKALRVNAGDTIAFEIDETAGIRVVPSIEPGLFARFAGSHRSGSSGMSAEQTNAWIRELRGHDENE